MKYEPPIMPLVIRPRAKPWDYVKGRRFRCCGGEGEHTAYCLADMDKIYMQTLKEITADEILYSKVVKK